MRNTYGRVLGRPGAVQFCAAGLLGRLPISMVGLGLVLLVSMRSGSYSLAGLVAAAYVLANAACAIAQGRIIDRVGQARFLPAAVAVFAIALALTVWSVQADAPVWVSLVCAALAGGSLPPVGSCVRARWAHLLDDPGEVHTAYSLEAVADECVFVLGPTAVTLLATSWHPVAGLAVAAGCGVLGTWWLAAQRGTEPPATGRIHRDTRIGLPWRVLGPLTVVCIALGVLFGASEVATVAFSEDHGRTSYAGPLLALWALGSLVAGLISGALTLASSHARRIRVGLLGLGVLMAPLMLVDSFWAMAVLLFLSGFGIAPTLIAAMALAEQVLPRARLTEGMSVLQTGMAGGVAAGAPLAGVVVDHVSASAAFAVPVVAAAIGAALAPRQHA